jgi:hypothetical protein
MNPSVPDFSARLKYPPGFRARRGLNWGFLGLLYTSFYLCRYNLSIANKSISDEFGFSHADMAGFASGLIDSLQCFGGSLAGYFLGKLLDQNWGWYFYFMAPFGLIGGLLMLTILGQVTAGAKKPAEIRLTNSMWHRWFVTINPLTGARGSVLLQLYPVECESENGATLNPSPRHFHVFRHGHPLSGGGGGDLFFQQPPEARPLVPDAPLHQLVAPGHDLRLFVHGTLQPHRRQKRLGHAHV